MDLIEMRLDKWLWAARFFKTRSLAHAAIDGGKVYVSGIRAKPSRIISVGQEIQISLENGQLIVIVAAISEQRGSASIASQLYMETEDSKKQREKLAEIKKLSGATIPSERPNSKERRALRKLKEEFSS